MSNASNGDKKPINVSIEEQQKLIIKKMTKEYYNYMKLLKLTRNFQKSPNLYDNLNFNDYNQNIAIVGHITQIVAGEGNFSNSCFPIIQTTLNRYIFQKGEEEPFSRRYIHLIRRRLFITNSCYKTKFLIPFNKMIQLSKKEKNQNFIFTGLSISLKSNNQLFFVMTDKSYIMQLSPQFYRERIRPMELAMEYNFSQIRINELNKNKEISKTNSAFTLQQIRQKLLEFSNQWSVIGVLRRIIQNDESINNNLKQCQFLLEVAQQCFPNGFNQIGVSKIFLKCNAQQEQTLKEFLKIGNLYLLKLSQINVSDSFMISFRLKHWRTNIILIQNQLTTIDYSAKEKQMSPFQLGMLLEPALLRNIYKFRVLKTDVNFFHVKVQCENCSSPLYYITQYEDIALMCKRQCGRVFGKLIIWAIIGVADQTGCAQLTLDNQEALTFFNLQSEELKIKEEIVKEDPQGKGLALYHKKQPVEGKRDMPFSGKQYEGNPYLSSIITRFLLFTNQKDIIGTPRTNLSENFHFFSEDNKRDFQISFLSSKQLLKKNKVNLNGNIRLNESGMKLIPHIKVQRVYHVYKK